MAIINHGKKEINLKIVYWGTGLGGKTENVIQLSKILGCPEPIILSTEKGRTLFFDFNPIEKELPNGHKVRFSIFTTPGQVIYAGARKLLLEGIDGIVFVADSQEKRHESNIISMEELTRELEKRGTSIEEVPLVIQYNKRDLPKILPVETLRADLNPFNRPDLEAIAVKGIGVKETFNEIAKLSLKEILYKQALF
ncbi:GTP-binding protein [Desulfurobacterium crinifex]